MKKQVSKETLDGTVLNHQDFFKSQIKNLKSKIKNFREQGHDLLDS